MAKKKKKKKEMENRCIRRIIYLFSLPRKRKPLLPRLVQLILILILQHTAVHGEARIATRIDHGKCATEGARGKCFDFGGAFGAHVFVV